MSHETPVRQETHELDRSYIDFAILCVVSDERRHSEDVSGYSSAPIIQVSPYPIKHMYICTYIVGDVVA